MRKYYDRLAAFTESGDKLYFETPASVIPWLNSEFYTQVNDWLDEAEPGKLDAFAIAGADKKSHWADAEIAGNKVIVSSKDVPSPVAVRYAWAMNPSQRNLLYVAAETSLHVIMIRAILRRAQNRSSSRLLGTSNRLVWVRLDGSSDCQIIYFLSSRLAIVPEKFMQTLRRPKVRDQVAGQIQQYIVGQKLGPGDRQPSDPGSRSAAACGATNVGGSGD